MTRDLLQEEQKESWQDWNWNSQDLIIQKKIWGLFNIWFLPRNLWTRLKDADKSDPASYRPSLSSANVFGSMIRERDSVWIMKKQVDNERDSDDKEMILTVVQEDVCVCVCVCVCVYVYCIQENDHLKISSKHSPLERLA